MKKSAVTGLPVALMICALSVGHSSLAQQNDPTPNEATAGQSSSGPSDTSSTTAIPDVVVTTTIKKKTGPKKKVEGTSAGGGSSDADQSNQSAGTDTGSLSDASEAETTEGGVILSGPAIADTGTTVFDANSVRMRTDGSGDANTFLRNLPNVQYQNDTSTDAGVGNQSIIDTRPLLLSINGGRTYENNLILNGVSINNITGPIERSTTTLNDTTLTPNIDVIFGLHPQQIYVPSEFLAEATVIDSNASAEYGEFLGGVVIYDLARPPTDRYRASINYSRQTDDMVSYILGTATGTNPLDRKAPTFEKDNLAVSIGAPITNQFGFIAQASHKTAETIKQKDYTLYDGFVTEDSENNFFRGAVSLRTDIGKFNLESSLTDYTQYWESYAYRDLSIEVQGKSSSTQLEYLTDLPGIQLAGLGLGHVKLESRAYYNSSDTENASPGDTVWNWRGNTRSKVGGVWTETFNSVLLSDWCRAVPIDTLPTNTSATSSNTTCREGGYADMLQGQDDLGLKARLTGDLLFGSFNIGGEAKSIEGRRARLEDYTLYGATTFLTAAQVAAGQVIVCPPGDDACTSEQFASSRNINRAFDVDETVNAIHGYAEVDQTLGWFNLRAGVRVDYEDYFENLNVAPRLAGTVTPLRGLSFTGGFNRYYQGESLYYALRDQQPRSLPNYSRTRRADGTLTDWTTTQSSAYYGYKDSDVDTPYTDEYTGAVRIKEPFLGGNIRLRYLERYSEDRFSSNPCPGVSNCIELNNDANAFYRSAIAEYTKYWHELNTPFLSAAAITTNVTWSEQTTSRNTYHDDYDGDQYILYNGQSYTPLTFTNVTGNLDIPIRIGATLSTNWFDDLLLVNLSAGYNLGYQGVYDTGINQTFEGRSHDVWEDKDFGSLLMLDVSGQVNVSENAAIEFQVNNLLNNAGNGVTTNNNPWLLGRSYWVGSTVRF
ncbi:hypothetical protein [Hyphomicrobium sp. LHD-15]|uniref:hypothetical protein n=1 Tax=Hyphomicrobium sp. LHD-15 TaxID=3072142 RepID=UPI00280DA777|nr:hypothetical protein [Hyphomicrobium sp. LHD-15]MDQ8699211.1 hypothetical protein [Hyphomicrobium sp. LHD-15]